MASPAAVAVYNNTADNLITPPPRGGAGVGLALAKYSKEPPNATPPSPHHPPHSASALAHPSA
ncbi:MAG: hypothetical protein ACK51T_08030, partial [bacterium]